MTPNVQHPIIVVNLPVSELAGVTAELRGAGYPVAPVGDASEIAAMLAGGAVIGAAVLDAETDPRTAVELRAALPTGPGSPPVIFVVSDDSLDHLVDAGALGPEDEVLVRPYAADSVRWRVEAVRIRCEVASGPTDTSLSVLTKGVPTPTWDAAAPIVAIFSPKGGVGKTTIATNLAAAAQTKHARRVLLVDADTISGHIATSLALEDVRTVADTWEDAGPGRRPGLLEIASGHGSGVRVVSLASGPFAADDLLEPERISAALSEARHGVDLVVVDLHPHYGDLNLTILSMANQILVPVTPDIPAIRGAVQFTEIAAQLGVRDRLAMIVNRANSGVAVADMERTVGMPALALIRSGGLLITRAANEGRTVIDLSPREKISADFQLLADRVLGVGQPAVAAGAGARESRARQAGGGIFGRRGAVRQEPVRV